MTTVRPGPTAKPRGPSPGWCRRDAIPSHICRKVSARYCVRRSQAGTGSSRKLIAATIRIQRWLQIYFPELLKVCGKFSAESFLPVLESAPYPADILALGAEGVNQIWREHKGQSSISKRGRRDLRNILFQAVLPLIRSNGEFREVYRYYTTRQMNPLKGKQAVVAVGCKLIRVFCAILTRGVDYDANRLRTDMVRPQEQQAASAISKLHLGKRPPFSGSGLQERGSTAKQSRLAAFYSSRGRDPVYEQQRRPSVGR